MILKIMMKLNTHVIQFRYFWTLDSFHHKMEKQMIPKISIQCYAKSDIQAVLVKLFFCIIENMMVTK